MITPQAKTYLKFWNLVNQFRDFAWKVRETCTEALWWKADRYCWPSDETDYIILTAVLPPEVTVQQALDIWRAIEGFAVDQASSTPRRIFFTTEWEN